MDTLNNPTLFNYRHGEFLQFMKNVLNVYAQFDTTALMLADKTSKLQIATDFLDEVFQPQLASELTPELSNLDARRDKALMGIKIYLESQLYREEPERLKAAQNLLANYASHGDRIDKLSYQQETAVLHAMLRDWNEDQLQHDKETLEITHWVDLLEVINKDFDHKYVKRAQETAPPAEIEDKRAKLREAYNDLTQDTIAYSRVAADKAPYLKIINMLNGLIDDYNLAVTQRLAGRSSDTENSNTIPVAPAE